LLKIVYFTADTSYLLSDMTYLLCKRIITSLEHVATQKQYFKNNIFERSVFKRQKKKDALA
ncbi:hypothetical protein L2W01_13770, partial [Staphylococcus aureus]